jgi:flagellar motor switch protein FliG
MAPAVQLVPHLEDLTGRQKVAIVLMALGETEAAKVTANLDPDEVEAISLEIAKLDRVDPALVQQVLDEWQHTERAAVSVAEGGVSFARRILEKAFGPTKAATVLKRIESQLHDHISLRNLRTADPQQIAALIRTEHPQLNALVLAFLDPGQTAGVLRDFEAHVGADVLLRMARMDKVMPDVLSLVEGSFGAESDLSVGGDGSAAGGPSAVAEVLNLVSQTMEKELMDGLSLSDPELSEEIKNLMFVFEDLCKLDDRGVLRVLRDVETRELALALKAASEELKDKILTNLSSRARDALLEEIEFLGPVRVSDVEAAQANIVSLVRTLEEAGEIVVGATDDQLIE